MAETEGQNELSHRQLAKCPTGIQGLDEITGGGLPRGRPTLVCGGAGCGKTLLSLEFVVRGAVTYGEPGVFMSFEETSEELAKNVASLGFDLADLEKQKLLALDFVYFERHEIEETGESTIWRASSSAWGTPLTPWGPNGWCWTRWRPCSRGFPTSSSYERNCAASSAG